MMMRRWQISSLLTSRTFFPTLLCTKLQQKRSVSWRCDAESSKGCWKFQHQSWSHGLLRFWQHLLQLGIFQDRLANVSVTLSFVVVSLLSFVVVSQLCFCCFNHFKNLLPWNLRLFLMIILLFVSLLLTIFPMNMANLLHSVTMEKQIYHNSSLACWSINTMTFMITGR